jgi:hypothetical protein
VARGIAEQFDGNTRLNRVEVNRLGRHRRRDEQLKRRHDQQPGPASKASMGHDELRHDE